MNSSHKSQSRGALMFYLICARINGWVNNGKAGDLRHRAHYDVVVINFSQVTVPLQTDTAGRDPPITNVSGFLRNLQKLWSFHTSTAGIFYILHSEGIIAIPTHGFSTGVRYIRHNKWAFCFETQTLCCWMKKYLGVMKYDIWVSNTLLMLLIETSWINDNAFAKKVIK